MPRSVTVTVDDAAEVTVTGGAELADRVTVPVQLEGLNRERIVTKMRQGVDVLEGPQWANADAAAKAEMLRRAVAWLLRLQAHRFEAEGPAAPAP